MISTCKLHLPYYLSPRKSLGSPPVALRKGSFLALLFLGCLSIAEHAWHFDWSKFFCLNILKEMVWELKSVVLAGKVWAVAYNLVLEVSCFYWSQQVISIKSSDKSKNNLHFQSS